MESRVDIPELRTFAGERVRIRLSNAHEYVGMLRTELLSERSVSVYLDCGNGDGATLYIEQIVGIWPER